jgi:DNA-binding SARP family transcriptional activator
MEFGVLGPVRVQGGTDAEGLTRPMPRALLALLLCRPNEPVSVDQLVDELWRGRPSSSARRSLQVHAHRLRTALGADRLSFRDGG